MARHILSRRRDREPYPCYITDLDLSAVDPGGRMQDRPVFALRQQLETALKRGHAGAGLSRPQPPWRAADAVRPPR
ncbi:hypothetical protein UMZ34_07040 [Halopseudomonas pachastrellae]|nr:hypothetical protein UMZ34_07040 [Halopseudomonas pachastrellae]